MLLAMMCILAAPSPERIEHAGRLWGQVRYLHPWLLSREVDWDGAFVRWVSRAGDAQDERASLQSMLEELHDPATHMEEAGASPAPAAPSWRWVEKDVLAIHLEPLASWSDMREQVARLQPEIAKARGVIVEALQQPPLQEGKEDVGDELEMLLPLLAARPLLAPAERVAEHSGYQPQVGLTSGRYESGLLEVASSEVPPAKSPPQRTALVIDATTPLPALALGLQRAGNAALVSEGPLDDRAVVRKRFVELAPGLRAVIRLGELDEPVAADLVVARGKGMDAAREWMRGPAGAGKGAALPPFPPALGWRPDATYPEMLAPSLEYRLLALARFWNVIDLFYPYKALLDRPWIEVLREFIPRFEAAADADAYARAVMELSAQVQDSHTSVRGPPAVTAISGEAGLGLRVQLLEGLPVVVELQRTDAAGIRPGDVIEKIDGEPLLERAAKLEKYAAASLPLGRRMRALDFALGGAVGSIAKLELSGGKRVELERQVRYARPESPAFRMLEGNVGYVDLTRLGVGQVDAMFDQLGATRALVLDMRGYPRGTAWAIAPRINVKGATGAALFARNVVTGTRVGEQEKTRLTFQQKIPETDKPIYQGRIVMLIDEFALSQAEHSGLFFEAATDLTYVGSPTAGANGDVTRFSLPGGIYVSFTGHEVRHSDGRQLQRVGLQPDVAVRPTLAGIRSGRDEVLERALQLLERSVTGNPRTP
jgi:C-terminal processing protease CtpA/Prc